MRDWIKIADRVPEEKATYLVCFREKKSWPNYETMVYNPETGSWSWNKNDLTDPGKIEVTHWAYLESPEIFEGNDFFVKSLEEIPITLLNDIYLKRPFFQPLSEVQLKLVDLFNGLVFRERVVLWKRYGISASEEQTFSEVARYFCVTTTQIGRMERKALRRLGYLLNPVNKVMAE